jgi:hypothetical protein
MTRDEIVDFLEWAKEKGQLQFPESRKVDMAKMYIKEQDDDLSHDFADSLRSRVDKIQKLNSQPVIRRLFAIHYRLRPGRCKWRCYSIRGLGYHIAIPITKWVFKIRKTYYVGVHR